MGSEKKEFRHLYIHVPFCRQKCLYCDFSSIPAGQKLRYRYLRALRKEISDAAPRLAPETIYIGGGTPSLLSNGEAGHLFQSLKTVECSRLKEFTIEANPESLDRAKLNLYKKHGVNRISIGVQSFENKKLKLLGRIHSAVVAERAIRLARKAGFGNFSIDLIFGLPGTDISYWKKTLARALEFSPPHISLYGLTYERGTPLKKLLRSGKLETLDEDTELEMYRFAVRALRKAGYRHYEISNFAEPGFESRHNIAYWHYKPFYGAGPSAASFDGERRWKNIMDVEKYCRRLEDGKSPCGRGEKLTGKRRTGEVLMLALRERRGITENEFRERTGMDLKSRYGEQLKSYRDMKLLSWSNGRLKFTSRGMEVADTILAEFFD
ncbi:MAG: radical SAM family heme chaperone HemW [Planctomycetota bacterium]